jgi:hypothetical protein
MSLGFTNCHLQSIHQITCWLETANSQLGQARVSSVCRSRLGHWPPACQWPAPGSSNTPHPHPTCTHPAQVAPPMQRHQSSASRPIARSASRSHLALPQSPQGRHLLSSALPIIVHPVTPLHHSPEPISCERSETETCKQMVRVEGLEPPRLAALVPKTSASTNSAIPAFVCRRGYGSLAPRSSVDVH